ncbi:hypothetical protein B0A50_03818 [Salinomyces thailandicus]|uniref:RBR-type E3 ubiquitin transferase n=1 Tax=Salinomyces thailandicus TaxID=706561 RepID=A0A4U0U0E6_9PEZI|nr:hypothetical protein B0A50_03818 [Salinomyces thailandica]
MVKTSINGSSRSSSKAVRTSRPKASEVPHKRQVIQGEQDTKTPDVEELRKRRAAYFGRPVAERQKVIRVKPAVASPASASSRPKTSSSSDVRRKKRSTSSQKSSSSSKRPKVPRVRDAVNTDYVYAATPPLGTDLGRSQDPVQERDIANGERRRHSTHSSSHRRSLSTLPETEVAPDDSISVVAERRTSGSHSRSRPSLKRSSTTPSNLPPIVEKSDDPSSSQKRRTAKRESTLLSTLFRRHTTTDATPTPPRLVECLTCGSDDIPHAHSAKLSCGHRMCHDCLQRIFEMSVKDPAHMPPRCCTDDHIPLKHVEKIFDLKFKMHWNRKYQEYNTKNRIYCPAPKCGEWIKPSHVHRDRDGKKYAVCPRCKLKVCLLCNNKAHKSRECPKDPEIAKLVEQAKEKGWQRCFNCSALVELKEGCNHMTCRCLAEFCMICGSKWKTCECPWFNYTNLPNPDRLNDMRVPEPIRVIYRRVLDATAPAARPEATAAADPPPQDRHPLPPRRGERTYHDELEQRRRQERLDADLARRLQLASLMDNDDDDDGDPSPRRRAQDEAFGIGTEAGHFMNDDYVRNAANVVMNAFGDVNMGRRRERASGRRRRARQTGQNGGEAGLAPNFLGDASVLGI